MNAATERVRPRPAGRCLASVLLVASAAVSVGVDANDSHLFNDAWPPHAVFHDVVLLGYLCLLAAGGLWLLWRRSAEPNVSLAAACAVVGGFWALFFVAAFFPGSSPAAHAGEAPPLPLGRMGYPNMLIAVAATPLSGLAYWLGRRQRFDQPTPEDAR